ncbi:MAG: aminotransferase class I/II-fold pyridoxal phosphate-dependent enzyme [Bacteroidales bacterium]|nr:aminotransferase class I/II-fold pyridoxal phosphate-dependent enzyme [Bacteroidales bacterium]
MSVKPSERISRVSEYYFSARLDQIRQMEKRGIDVINLGIGSPDTPPAPEVINNAVESIYLPGSHNYQPYRGVRELREAFGEWYKMRYNVSFDPESEILPLLGSKEGIMHISMAFLNRGDGVLVPDPGYPAYAAAARLCSARCIYYDLTSENGWMPDPEHIEKTGVEGVKLMWVNFPNMPTGKRASRELFDKLVDFGRRNNILIVNDNPYGQILNDHPLSIMESEGSMETALELNSLSKSHSMAGWRIGMVGGSKEYIDYILRVKSNMDSGMFLPLQRAAIAALKLPDSWTLELNRMYRERRETVYALLDSLGCRFEDGQTGMFVWARIPDGHTCSMDFSDYLLDRFALFITPGAVFGANGKGYVRISLCNPVEKIEEAVARVNARQEGESVKENVTLLSGI